MSARTRRSANPDGRMPLPEHFSELRHRVFVSAFAIGGGTVAGWFAYPPVFAAIQEPLIRLGSTHGITANINYSDIMQAFNLHLKIAFYLGLVVSSPIWLYQLWAFILPGMKKHEKRYAYAFSAAATPLLFTGLWLGWTVMPTAIGFFTSFAEPGTSVLPDAGEYVGFVTRLLMVFGIAFLLPLILVALNVAGLVSGVTLRTGWRFAVVLVFLFAALASPSPEVGSMLALAFPMVGLYMIAVGIALLNDRRRDRRQAAADAAPINAEPIAPTQPLSDD